MAAVTHVDVESMNVRTDAAGTPRQTTSTTPIAAQDTGQRATTRTEGTRPDVPIAQPLRFHGAKTRAEVAAVLPLGHENHSNPPVAEAALQMLLQLQVRDLLYVHGHHTGVRAAA